MMVRARPADRRPRCHSAGGPPGTPGGRAISTSGGGAGGVVGVVGAAAVGSNFGVSTPVPLFKVVGQHQPFIAVEPQFQRGDVPAVFKHAAFHHCGASRLTACDLELQGSSPIGVARGARHAGGSLHPVAKFLGHLVVDGQLLLRPRSRSGGSCSPHSPCTLRRRPRA